MTHDQRVELFGSDPFRSFYFLHHAENRCSAEGSADCVRGAKNRCSAEGSVDCVRGAKNRCSVEFLCLFRDRVILRIIWQLSPLASSPPTSAPRLPQTKLNMNTAEGGPKRSGLTSAENSRGSPVKATGSRYTLKHSDPSKTPAPKSIPISVCSARCHEILRECFGRCGNLSAE